MEGKWGWVALIRMVPMGISKEWTGGDSRGNAESRFKVRLSAMTSGVKIAICGDIHISLILV
jgi:hypothetical protein